MVKKVAIGLVVALYFLGPATVLLGIAVLMNPSAQASCLASTTAIVGEVPDSLTATTAGGQTITLNRTQLTHAATIITVGGQTPGVGQNGILVALMAALTESTLRMLANTSAYPESANYPHDGDGSDHDSLGLFQMRPQSGWGTVAELMDPTYQARAFYGGPAGLNHPSPRGLLDIPNWEDLSLDEAAQAVEVSAYPDRYTNYEPVAQTIYARLTTGGVPAPSASPPASTGQVVQPLPTGSYTITEIYGERVHPITGERSMHWGTDMAAPAGTPILVIADGVVAHTGPAPLYGNVIIIDHLLDGQPVASMYGHMPDSGVNVRPGDQVIAGQQIGAVGSAGISTGPHLHVEIRPGGSNQPQSGAVDPQSWLADHDAERLHAPTAGGPGCDSSTLPDVGDLPPAPAPFTGQPGGRLDDPTGTGGFVTRPTADLYAETRAAFPDTGWACWDPHPQNTTSDHPLGRACDITFGNQLGAWPTPAQTAQGWRIATWLQTYAAQLHVSYVIFDGQIWSRGDTDWRPYTSTIYDTTTPTGSHSDHVHASTLD